MNITWEEVKKAKPKMIFYSANTVWWTHDEKDLKKGPVPLDAFGSPLFQSEKVKEFLDEDVIKACPAYGKNPLRTLMACHAKNIEWLRNLDGFRPSMKFSEVAALIDNSGGVE